MLELRRRRLVAFDETKLKLNGGQFYLWAAVDVDTHEVLGFKASWHRSSLDAILFMREVLKLCRNKPLILVDKGPWYPWAFMQLGLRFRHMRFGLRNSIEQWFSQLKGRTNASTTTSQTAQASKASRHTSQSTQQPTTLCGA
jgi:transposase-like protein